jgi:hypothetical protein
VGQVLHRRGRAEAADDAQPRLHALDPELWKTHPAAADPRIQFFFKIIGTRQVREFLFKFPYVGKVTRLNQDLYDQIYLKRIAKGDIKKKLDETVPAAQKVIDEERAKLKL